MTDGNGSYDQLTDLFEEENFVASRRNMKTFNCFCVGYSKNFVLQSLIEISMIANGKTYKFEDDRRIDYVHQANKNSLVHTIMEIGETVSMEEVALRKQAKATEESIDYLKLQCEAEKKRKRDLHDQLMSMQQGSTQERKEAIESKIETI